MASEDGYLCVCVCARVRLHCQPPAKAQEIVPLEVSQSQGIWPGGTGFSPEGFFSVTPQWGCFTFRPVPCKSTEGRSSVCWAGLAFRVEWGPWSQAGGCAFLVSDGVLLKPFCP